MLKRAGLLVILFITILEITSGCVGLQSFLWPTPQVPFIISGGILPSQRLGVDDDLIVKVDGHVVFADEDGWATGDSRGAQYNGDPIAFEARPDSTLEIIALDAVCCSAWLSTLYLHYPDGSFAKLTEEISAPSQGRCSLGGRNSSCVVVFFDKTYKIRQLDMLPKPEDCVNQLGRWPIDTVEFYILSRGDAESVPSEWTPGILEAAKTWHESASKVGAAFHLVYKGVIDQGSSLDPQTVNVIKIDPALDEKRELGRGTIAGYESKERLEMVFNLKRLNAKNVRAAALHEFGHWTGRDHPRYAGCRKFTVMAGVTENERDLKEVDILGLVEAYGKAP